MDDRHSTSGNVLLLIQLPIGDSDFSFDIETIVISSEIVSLAYSLRSLDYAECGFCTLYFCKQRHMKYSKQRIITPLSHCIRCRWCLSLLN